jgi:hypothetical protein
MKLLGCTELKSPAHSFATLLLHYSQKRERLVAKAIVNRLAAIFCTIAHLSPLSLARSLYVYMCVQARRERKNERAKWCQSSGSSFRFSSTSSPRAKDGKRCKNFTPKTSQLCREEHFLFTRWGGGRKK